MLHPYTAKVNLYLMRLMMKNLPSSKISNGSISPDRVNSYWWNDLTAENTEDTERENREINNSGATKLDITWKSD
jgi:hypothetical protein